MDKLEETTKAIERLGKVFPIYNDLIKPSAQELGKGLETVAKTVNLALEPLSAMIWGYDQVKRYLIHSISTRLKSVESQSIVTPPPEIAIPAIDALRWCASKKEIRELFANLIARSMCAEYQDWCHPSFVNILKELTPDEAVILQSIYYSNHCFFDNGAQCSPIMEIEVEVRQAKGGTCTQRNIAPLQDTLNLQKPNVFELMSGSTLMN